MTRKAFYRHALKSVGGSAEMEAAGDLKGEDVAGPSVFNGGVDIAEVFEINGLPVSGKMSCFLPNPI